MKALLTMTLVVLLAPVGHATPIADPIGQTFCMENLGGRYDLPSGLPPTDAIGLERWVQDNAPIQLYVTALRKGTLEFVGVPGEEYMGGGQLGWNFQGLCTTLTDLLECVLDPLRCVDADRTWVEEHAVQYWGDAPITITDLAGVRVVSADDFLRDRF